MFSTQNLRTHGNIGKQRKIGYKTRFVYFLSRCSDSASGWQGPLCNSRVDFLHELLKFGKDVKVFLQLAI